MIILDVVPYPIDTKSDTIIYFNSSTTEFLSKYDINYLLISKSGSKTPVNMSHKLSAEHYFIRIDLFKKLWAKYPSILFNINESSEILSEIMKIQLAILKRLAILSTISDPKAISDFLASILFLTVIKHSNIKHCH